MPASRTGRSISMVELAFAILVSLCAFTRSSAAAPAPPLHAYGVTAEGEWAVAGASSHDGYRGAALIFHRVGRDWMLDATLAPAGRGPVARFGASVAIERNTVVVGAPWDDGWKG